MEDGATHIARNAALLVIGGLITLLVTSLTGANTAALEREDQIDAARRDAYSEMITAATECSRLDEATLARIDEIYSAILDQKAPIENFDRISDTFGLDSDCAARLAGAQSRVFLVAPLDVSGKADILQYDALNLRGATVSERLYQRRALPALENVPEDLRGEVEDARAALEEAGQAFTDDLKAMQEAFQRSKSDFLVDAKVDIEIPDSPGLLADGLREFIYRLMVSCAALALLTFVAAAALDRRQSLARRSGEEPVAEE